MKTFTFQVTHPFGIGRHQKIMTHDVKIEARTCASAWKKLAKSGWMDHNYVTNVKLLKERNG